MATFDLQTSGIIPNSRLETFRSIGRAANTSILFLVFIFVFIVILLLISALNLQRAVAADVDDSITATVGQVRLDVDMLNDLDLRTNHDNDVIVAANRAQADNDAQMDACLQAVVSAIRKHATENPQIPSALIALPRFENLADNTLRLNERLELYKQKVTANADKSLVTNDMLSRYFAGLERDLLPVMNRFFPARDRWRNADQLKKGMEGDKAALTAPPKDVAANRLSNESYRTVVEDFRTFEMLVGSRLFGVVLIPNPVLVLLLSVFMGMLGSLIHVARRLVIEGKPISGHEMFYRVGLGAAVALALFFFASAGVLTLSQSSTGKIDSNMSPYLISFLGITAGFLSERTTAWMREVGERTFKLENGPQRSRWATRLAAELAKQNIAPGIIAEATGSQASDIEAYGTLTKLVPGTEQALLAAYLRVHPSMLFTDIDPKGSVI
ncbi:MAG TPA: hypothetical protein VG387_22140 [Rhizomicrobium sp.]|jgi:hypothetical protein|nr:hypothetical protein [Rhizomicrobium sp.]